MNLPSLMFSHSQVMIFPVLLVTFFSVSEGWDHLYGTGLDIGQKMDFKSTGGGIWILLKPRTEEIVGFSSPSAPGKIRMLKRKKRYPGMDRFRKKI